MIVYFHDVVVYKKAFDISRKGSHPRPTPTPSPKSQKYKS